MKLQARKYQERDIQKLREAFRTHRSVLYQLSTGGGKTVVALLIILGALSKGKTIWFIVNRRRLVKQTSAALHGAGIHHGIVASGFSMDVFAKVQVIMVQTVVNRLHKLPRPDFLIPDEAHNIRAATFQKVVDSFPEANILGLSATPCRLDGKGLNAVFNAMVTGPPLSWLIAEGYLCEARLYAPNVGAEDYQPRKMAGEFVASEVGSFMDKPAITGCAISHYKNICGNKPALVFCATVQHAENTANLFKSAGFRSASIDGTMDDHELDGILSALGNKRMDVVTSCDLVSEGFDLPAITVAIFLRHTASLRLIIQMIGRALRPVYAPGYDLSTKEGRLKAIAASDKPFAIILDHVGNIIRHNLQGLGLPEYDIEWTLEGKTPGREKQDKEKDIKVKQCPGCYAVHPPAPICPYCKHVYVVSAREMEQLTGELVEIDRKRLEQIEADKARMFARREEGKCSTLEDFQALAKERGYNAGWAYHRFNARKQRGGGQRAFGG